MHSRNKIEEKRHVSLSLPPERKEVVPVGGEEGKKKRRNIKPQSFPFWKSYALKEEKVKKLLGPSGKKKETDSLAGHFFQHNASHVGGKEQSRYPTEKKERSRNSAGTFSPSAAMPIRKGEETERP